MKYLITFITLVLFSSCEMRYQIETPWYTSHCVMWNKPRTVDDVATITLNSHQVIADYPAFETWFKLEFCNEDEGELTLHIDRQDYVCPVKILKESYDVWVGIISDKEFIRINPTSMITILRFKGVHRVYINTIQ